MTEVGRETRTPKIVLRKGKYGFRGEVVVGKQHKQHEVSRRKVLAIGGIGTAAITLGVLGGPKVIDKVGQVFYARNVKETKQVLGKYRTGYVCEKEIPVSPSRTIRTSPIGPAAGLANFAPKGKPGERDSVILLPEGSLIIEGNEDIEPGASDSKFWVVWAENYSLRFSSLYSINEDLRESGAQPIDPKDLVFGRLEQNKEGNFNLITERGAILLNLPNLG